MRRTKKDIYAGYGIQFDGKHIYCEPLRRWIPLLLVNGNKKIGRGVWHFSITAGTAPVSSEIIRKALGDIAAEITADLVRACSGTCRVNCPGCYAQSGHYVKSSVRASLTWRTFLCRTSLEWVENAISAQIEADRIQYIRIHAAGDFFSAEYVQMWTRIAQKAAGTTFWTYTKTLFAAVAEFDSLPNANVVKSLADGRVNFGHAGYLMKLYEDLRKAGKSVYICRCGVDKGQHCNGCHHCSASEYVLFLEHGTDYRPEEDPDYPDFVKLVNSQPESTTAAA